MPIMPCAHIKCTFEDQCYHYSIHNENIFGESRNVQQKSIRNLEKPTYQKDLEVMVHTEGRKHITHYLHMSLSIKHSSVGKLNCSYPSQHNIWETREIPCTVDWAPLAV